MPKVILQDKDDFEDLTVATESYRRVISLPANTEILESLTIGEVVRVTLVGTVEALSGHDDDLSFSVKAESVEAYPADMEDEDEAFESGFKRGHAKPY